MVSSFAYVAYAEYALIIIIFGYAGYWAFNMMRALVVGLYRSQASGTGLIAVALGATVVTAAANVTGNQLVLLPFSLAVAVTSFYFIDASTLAARRSDPLLRDTLQWSRVRRYMWALVIFLASVSGLANFLLPAPIKYSSFEGILFTQSAYVLVFGIGAVVLPLSVLKSRDLTLRKHYRWFGMSLLFLLLFGIVVGPAPPENFLGGTEFTPFVIADFEAAFFCMFMAAYCLYRSARSLAPLNRMETLDVTSPELGAIPIPRPSLRPH